MRRDELAARVRANKGRRLWPDFRHLLEVVLDREITERDRLSAQETEAVKTRFYERLRSKANAHNIVVHRDRLPELWKAVGRVAAGVADLDCILLHQHDEFTGAVRVSAGAVLAEPRRVWGVVGMDLRLTTTDADDGLCLEYNHVHPEDEYELTTWGRFADPLRRDGA